jgi:DNA ligase (NAD+)
VNAGLLARHFDGIDSLMSATAAELLEIEGIGDQAAASLVDYFSDPAVRKMISEILETGVEIGRESVEGKQLDGRVILFTGSMSNMSRNEAKQRVKSLGGQVASAISRRVTDLVAGEKPGSKLKKAQEEGIRILDEGQFLDLIGGQGASE